MAHNRLFLVVSAMVLLLCACSTDREPSIEPSVHEPQQGNTFTNSIGMKFVEIKPGNFLMGSPASEPNRRDDEAQCPVRLTRGFFMGVTEVTQAQWKAVMGTDPSRFKGDNLPVERVSWDDAVAFCLKLSEREGKNYRLPTEAEWECACRAGTTTAFNTGPTISTDEANYDGNYAYAAGRKGVYRKKTMPVGSFKPNAWGIYDMHGNVREWCSDWYGEYPGGEAVDPSGPESGEQRVLRGGSWGYFPRGCRSAFRIRFSSGFRGFSVGFRVVLNSN